VTVDAEYIKQLKIRRDRIATLRAMLTPELPQIVQQVTGGAYHHRTHLDALTALLRSAVADVAAGKSRNIVVSMPPGMGKSVTCSVVLPLYVLARYPDWNVANISSEASLATKFSRDARRHAPTAGVQLAPDSGQVTEWETTAGGGMIARGVGGTIVGRRVKVMIIDDPVRDARAAASEVEREALWDWYIGVAKGRMAPASLSLLVMTRWHESDISARLLEQGWEEFRLPALAEDGDPLGRELGEPLLTPQADEAPTQALIRWEQTQEEVGSYTWAGQYQQRPAPAGGSIFDPTWLKPIEGPLDLDIGTWITSWDLTFGASKIKGGQKVLTGDYCVGTVWQLLPGRFILHDMVRLRAEFTGQLASMRQTIERYPRCSRHLIEAAANGAAAVDMLRREVDGVTPIKPLGGKVERWQAATPTMEAGRVEYMPGEYINPLIAEMAVAPNGTHDDTLDSVAQAINWGRVRVVGSARVAKRQGQLPGW
jgi:predicted phage terminase large subunit-like protein